MAQPTTTTKILERCQISPPSGSVPPTTLPLTFFDIQLIPAIPMQRLFFFDLPLTTHHFTLTVVPKLKHSLSLSLRHFFPFAADLVIPAPPQEPHLLFSEDSSVSFTVAESTADFDHLISDDPRDTTDYHPLVMALTPPSKVLSIQVTVFPNSGVAIGATFHHVAADGKAFGHFIKSWAFIFWTISASQDSSTELESPPCHDRDGIVDPHGLRLTLLKDYWASTSDSKDNTGHRLENKVRANFVMGRAQIAKLRQSVLAQCDHEEEPRPWRLSTFVVAVAYTWVQLMKSETEADVRSETCHLLFAGDCRNRTGFEPLIPDTYFGNCLAMCYVSVKRSDLLGEKGIFCAAKAIGERINVLREAPLRGADKWISDLEELSKHGGIVTVPGSPYLRYYDTDFGWGRPRKTQTVHDDPFQSISLSVSHCPSVETRKEA